MEQANQELFMTIVAAILTVKVIAFFAGNAWRMLFGGGFTKETKGASVKPEAFDGAAGKSAG